MNYFLMSQDMDFQNTVSIKREEIPEAWRSPNRIERRLSPSAEQFAGKNYNILVESSGKNVYPDLLEFPLPLLSETLKDIVSAYVPELSCSCVLLSDREERQQHIYWIFELDCLDCLSDKTVFYPDGTFKKLVLDKEKIQDRAVFRVNGAVQKPMIIRGDVAESILRRDLLGIRLECVEVRDGGTI